MSLLSLPDELLWRCLPERPSEKRDSILHTCRRLADLILQHPPGLHLHIPRIDMAGLSSEPDWRLSLRKVLTLCPGVRYVLLGHHETPLTDEELHKCFLGDMPVPPSGATWPQNPTAFLTHLSLHCITTAQLVPDVVATMCPKLKRLKLYWPDIEPPTDDIATDTDEHRDRYRSRCSSSSSPTPTPTTTHAPAAGISGSMGAQAASHIKTACSIERLTVHNGIISLQSGNVAAQLRALPNLRHLDWCITHGKRGHWGSMMQAVGQQLTQLRMTSWKTELDGPSMQWRVPKDLSPLVSLVDLRIAVVVTDAIMQQLLQQLPHVQQLHVDSFKITEDYSSRQCSWQGVYMRHVIIATLPLLPLNKVTWLGYDVWWWWGSKVTLPAPADDSTEAATAAIAVTQAAVAVAAACGGMQATGAELDDRNVVTGPHRATVHIKLPQHYTEEQLYACLPLLRPLVGIELMAPGLSSYGRGADGESDDDPDDEEPDLQQVKRLDVSLALITALGKELPQLKQVEFSHCRFAPGALINMNRVLPKLDRLCFYKRCFDCMPEIILLCGTLTRQVNINLPSKNAHDLDRDYKWLVRNAFRVGGICYDNVHWVDC